MGDVFIKEVLSAPGKEGMKKTWLAAGWKAVQAKLPSVGNRAEFGQNPAPDTAEKTSWEIGAIAEKYNSALPESDSDCESRADERIAFSSK